MLTGFFFLSACVILGLGHFKSLVIAILYFHNKKMKCFKNHRVDKAFEPPKY